LSRADPVPVALQHCAVPGRPRPDPGGGSTRCMTRVRRRDVPVARRGAAVRRNNGAPGHRQRVNPGPLSRSVTGVTRLPLMSWPSELEEGRYRPDARAQGPYIPKAGCWRDGRQRPLSISSGFATGIVQAAVKNVLEPVFEADFTGRCSFGFPARGRVAATMPCRCSSMSAGGAAGGLVADGHRQPAFSGDPRMREVDASG